MLVIQIVLVIVVLFSAMNLAYQIYKMTVLDAECRGMKRPKLWGIFVTGGNNGSGILLYLLGRRKYPINISEENKNILELRKKKVFVCLVFMAISSICLIGCMIFFDGTLINSNF